MFDPNCFLVLSKALDLMNLGHGFTNLGEGTKRIMCASLLVGVKQDRLIPVQEQRNLVNILHGYGRNTTLVELNSKFGHDAMYNEDMQRDAFTPLVRDYLEYKLADLAPHEQHHFGNL